MLDQAAQTAKDSLDSLQTSLDSTRISRCRTSGVQCLACKTAHVTSVHHVTLLYRCGLVPRRLHYIHAWQPCMPGVPMQPIIHCAESGQIRTVCGTHERALHCCCRRQPAAGRPAEGRGRGAHPPHCAGLIGFPLSSPPWCHVRRAEAAFARTLAAGSKRPRQRRYDHGLGIHPDGA